MKSSASFTSDTNISEFTSRYRWVQVIISVLLLLIGIGVTISVYSESILKENKDRRDYLTTLRLR